MKTYMKRLISMLMILVFLCFLSSCRVANDVAVMKTTQTPIQHNNTYEPIRIGVLIPLSGSQAQAGIELRQAMSLFQDIINGERHDIALPLSDTSGLPNLDGRKIELVYGDVRTPDVALSEAERLITSENVVAICGLFSSASAKTAAVSTEKYKVPLFAEATSPTLTQKGYQYFFRVFPDDTQYVRDTYEYLTYLNKEKKANIQTISLLSEDTEFGKNIAKLETSMADEYGFEIISNITYNSNATNVVGESIKTKKANPDVILMSSYISDVILYIKTFKQLNYTPKLIIGQRGGFMNSELFTALGQDVEGLQTTSAWSLDLPLKFVEQIGEVYRLEYSNGQTLSPDVLKVAVDLYVLSLAMNQSGSTNADDIKIAMQNLSFPSDDLFFPGNGFAFDASGQNTAGKALICQIQDGKYRTVYPADIRTIDEIYPLTPWMQRP